MKTTPDPIHAAQVAARRGLARSGAALLEILGHHDDADLGGAWSYIKHYAAGSESKALALAFELLDRTSKAVALILETADQTTPAEAIPA